MNRKLILIIALIFAFTITLVGCGAQTVKQTSEGPSDEKVEINISAAASLTDALTEIQAEYAKESNAKLMFNFGASGAIQQQIEQGAPCDLFISAAADKMDLLEEAGLIVADSRKDLLGNTLVLIASAEKTDIITSAESLTSSDVKSIAIGTPDSVPAGKYAQQSLQNQGLWDKIQSKCILGKDVSQVLEYVDSGNVDCGFVYKTDAIQMKTGKIVAEMSADSHDAIVYPAALVKDSAQPEAAAAFYKFLQTDYAKGVFEKYGFKVLQE